MQARCLCDIKSYQQVISMANKIVAATFYIKDYVELARVYCDLSSIYAYDSKNQEMIIYAKRLIKKAIRLMYNNGIYDDELEVHIYQNLSAIYNQLERYDDSVECIRVAYEMIQNPNRYFYLLSDLKFNEAYAFFKLGNLDQAISCFEQSHQYALKSKKINLL